jgi:hypothetical protein
MLPNSRVDHDGWYDQYWRLDEDLDRNRCLDGERQSPQDLCETNDRCNEYHQPRPRVSKLVLYEKLLLATVKCTQVFNSRGLPYHDTSSSMYRPVNMAL